MVLRIPCFRCGWKQTFRGNQKKNIRTTGKCRTCTTPRTCHPEFFPWCKSSICKHTSRFVRCAPARQLNATTEYTLSELELHKRKWSSPRLDAPFGKHRKNSKKLSKVASGILALGVRFQMPVHAMFLWSQSAATTWNTLISSKLNVYCYLFGQQRPKLTSG